MKHPRCKLLTWKCRASLQRALVMAQWPHWVAILLAKAALADVSVCLFLKKKGELIMKIKHLLGMAAVALMAAACSNDVNDVLAPEAAPQKGIPFTATLTPKSFDATTRALTMGEGGKSLNAQWEQNETLALIYDVHGSSVTTMATVSDVTDGVATIDATLHFKVTEGTEVTLVYPYSAVNGTGYAEPSSLTGDLSDPNLDIRYGTGTIKINDGTATLKGGATLAPQFCIVELKFKSLTDGEDDFTAMKSLSIDLGDDRVYTITPYVANTTLYAALPSLTDSELWFSAIDDNGKPYIGKGTANLGAGYFYQTTLKMATVGNVIGSDGKFYKDADAAGTAAEAMIAYLGNEATDAPHGLAIALEPANSNYVTWDASGDNNSEKTAAELVAAWGGTPASGTWRLPSAYDWQRMFIGCGSTDTYISKMPVDNNDGIDFKYGNFFTLWSEATGSEFQFGPYWSSTELYSNKDTELAWCVYLGEPTANLCVVYKDINLSILACLAF